MVTVYCPNETSDATTSDITMTSSSEDLTSFSLIADLSRLPIPVTLSATAAGANLLVMICIVKDQKLHRPANYYIFSLSFIEGFIAVIPVNGLLAYYVFNGWPLGQFLCKVFDVSNKTRKCCTDSSLARTKRRI
jgi:7 transmembrane receptor (rhodopsin family)